MPMTAERKFPMIILRGWARGDSIVLYSKIAAAPCYVSAISLSIQYTKQLTKLAITTGTPWSCITGIMKTASMVIIPTNAPKKAHPAMSTLPISLLGPSRYPKNRAIGFGSLWTGFEGRYGFRCRSISNEQYFASVEHIFHMQKRIQPSSRRQSRK